MTVDGPSAPATPSDPTGTVRFPDPAATGPWDPIDDPVDGRVVYVWTPALDAGAPFVPNLVIDRNMPVETPDESTPWTMARGSFPAGTATVGTERLTVLPAAGEVVYQYERRYRSFDDTTVTVVLSVAGTHLAELEPAARVFFDSIEVRR